VLIDTCHFLQGRAPCPLSHRPYSKVGNKRRRYPPLLKRIRANTRGFDSPSPGTR
jgi:hypothetical protein